jgi:hypothetical protein
MSGSSIAAIVDYSAVLAAGIQNVMMPNGTRVGVRSVYGAGQNLYADPLRAGQMIQPCPENPTEPFTHFSVMPEAPDTKPITQQGLEEWNWTIPMRLALPRGDAATATATLLPFYNAYKAALTANGTDWTLGGLALNANISSFDRSSDASWLWLEMELLVVEIVSYS